MKSKKIKEFSITPEEVYKRVWKCRDFEISHLWQRSVFLAAFLLAIFTAYGGFFYKTFLCLNDTKVIIVTPDSINNLEQYDAVELSNPKTTNIMNHFVGLSLALIGYIFSVLWVMMAKGSKYWFECYETAIDEFENDTNGTGKLIIDYPHHGNLNHNKNLSSSPFSPYAYRFSVSKINICVGVVFQLFYLICITFHIWNLLQKKLVCSCVLENLLISILISFLVIFFIYKNLEKLCNSSEN